jgi:hypothetical protein
MKKKLHLYSKFSDFFFNFDQNTRYQPPPLGTRRIKALKRLVIVFDIATYHTPVQPNAT